MKIDSKPKRRRRRRKRRSLKNLKKKIPFINNHSKYQGYFLILKLIFLFPMITTGIYLFLFCVIINNNHYLYYYSIKFKRFSRSII